MATIQLSDDLYEEAEKRAREGGFEDVDAFIDDLLRTRFLSSTKAVPIDPGPAPDEDAAAYIRNKAKEWLEKRAQQPKTTDPTIPEISPDEP